MVDSEIRFEGLYVFDVYKLINFGTVKATAEVWAAILGPERGTQFEDLRFKTKNIVENILPKKGMCYGPDLIKAVEEVVKELEQASDNFMVLGLSYDPARRYCVVRGEFFEDPDVKEEAYSLISWGAG
jgi:hypothetical protein